MALKKLEEFQNDEAKKELYLERVWPDIEEFKERIIISNLKEPGIDSYYNNLKFLCFLLL